MQMEILMDLNKIQPSQLFISIIKLEKVLEWFDPMNYKSYDAIPVKELDGKIVFVDGHTRAFAAYLKGADKLKVYWENEELSWEAYQVCVDWCVNEGIFTIFDLKDRVIDSDEYQKQWIERCTKMHQELGL